MDAAVALGLDLGGTKCLGLAVDNEGEILRETRHPTPVGADAIIDTLVAVAEELVVADGVAVGVGAPGLVTRDGVLRFAPNLPGVVELDVRQRLKVRLGAEARVHNDATSA